MNKMLVAQSDRLHLFIYAIDLCFNRRMHNLKDSTNRQNTVNQPYKS